MTKRFPILLVLALHPACGTEPASDTACPGTWYVDADGDGYGDPLEVRCHPGSDRVKIAGDCDDTDPTVYPGADEYCNGRDNDCNGVVDDDHAVDAETWYRDADGDGYGDPDASTSACTEPTGHVADDTDCDDTDPEVNPHAEEICDGIDNDCDGLIDPDCVAICGDGAVTGEEECEAEDDAACPGRCSGWCMCPSRETGNLEIHVVDVGQGDAILVLLPSGFTLLVDGGGSGSEWTVARHLLEQGIHRLDYVLASHLHQDHIAGLTPILADHPEVVACIDHGGAANTQTAQDWRRQVEGCHHVLERGDAPVFDPEVAVDVLHANQGSSGENLNSIVLRLTWDGVTVLLGGDCETYGCEDQLDPGPIDIYKVHHHGSHGSSAPWFVEAMQPSLAVIPVGDNSYGHPSIWTLMVLESAGAEILRSDIHGTVKVVVGAGSWFVEHD